jgi:polyisoprenoid-binding protein YceI
MSASDVATGPITGTWNLDSVHSSVGFEVSYLAGTFRGTFRDVSGQLTADSSGTATLEGTAKAASVDVKDENLAAHLQSPDFFDTERNPELRFTAREVRLDGDTATVQGDLTIKGVTKPITATGAAAGPMADAFGNERVNLRLSTNVKRSDFGITWNMPLPTGQQALADDVAIVTDLYFVKGS